MNFLNFKPHSIIIKNLQFSFIFYNSKKKYLYSKTQYLDKILIKQQLNMAQIFTAVAKIRSEHIDSQQNAIRQFFQKFNSPFYYISYSDFCNNFEVHAGKNFKQQNLNIIDTHLKYRQWCYEQMAPYKWTPIILYSIMRLIRLRRPPLIIPFIYTTMFDHYLYPFFTWLHKDDKNINIRYEFATKLSKIKNKQRRVKLWKNLQKSLKRQDQIFKKVNKQVQIPHKYIKFGFPSEYVFHAQVDDVQMSTILQTTFFESYVNFRYPTVETPKHLLSHLLSMKNKFIEYKNDPDNKKYLLDLNEFMKFKDIKQTQIYQLSTCIQKRVRRWLQTFMYDRKNTIYYSNWTMDKLVYLYEHRHLNEEPRYNIEQNTADLCLYYGLILLPTLVLKFVKR